MNFAVLGLGRAGHFHLNSLKLLEGSKTQVVFDVDTDRAKAVAETWGAEWAPTAKEAMERDDVEGVIIASPTESHFEYVIQAFEAGKPVFTEKPLGNTLVEIDESYKKAQETHLPLFVGFQRRFDASFDALVQGVHGGDIGKLQYLRSASRDNPVPALEYLKDSGGIYHDCMIHDIDMVCHIVQEKPTHIAAFSSAMDEEIGAIGDVDNAVVTFSFASGVIATIDNSRHCSYGYDQRIEAFGTGGMLQAENRHKLSLVHANESGFNRPQIDYSFPTRYKEAYVREIECFIECLKNNKPMPVTHEQVRTNHILAGGLGIAAREKRVLAFEDIENQIE